MTLLSVLTSSSLLELSLPLPPQLSSSPSLYIGGSAGSKVPKRPRQRRASSLLLLR
jgi:hypothetical protein